MTIGPISQPLLRAATWALLAAIVLATLVPIELRPETGLSPNRERFLVFAALGGAFWLAYPRRQPLTVTALLAGVGVLEAFQHLAPRRHGELRDALIKAAGALLGNLGGASLDRVMIRADRAPPTTR